MMKKHVFLLAAVILVGCTYEGKTLKTYMADPASIIRDPHFENYEERRNASESLYLNKEITYAEYIEQRNALDEQYSKEVQERDKKVVSPTY